MRRFRASADEEAWRNPSVTPVRFEGAAKPRTGRPPVGAEGAAPSLEAGLLTLRRILDLCADPKRHAQRLARRMIEADLPLIAAEVKAFAAQA
jgi:hypothetical protein